MRVNKSVIELAQGDITDIDTDALINAANTALQLGAGVAGPIRRKGGPKIQDECNKIGGCPVGGAVITSGGNLKARHVIHAVGPVYGDSNEDEKLRNATLNSLKLADQHHLRSIAFPAISTGVFGFPIDRCAEIMLTTTRNYLSRNTRLEKVIFCLYDRDAFNVFETTLKTLSA